MFGTAAQEAPTASDLRARFALGEQALVVDEVVEPFPRGARHQPRVRRNTRVRIRDPRTGTGRSELSYLVEILDERGRGSGYWAVIAEHNLTVAPSLPLFDWLRSLRF